MDSSDGVLGTIFVLLIFFLSFGKEDYIELFLHNSSSSSGMMFRNSSQYFATILVNQVANAARYLYNANARKIICLGIMPLGCTSLSTTSKTWHFSALMQNSAAQFHSKILHKVQISKITLSLIQSCPNQILQVPNHVSIMSKPKSSFKAQQHRI